MMTPDRIIELIQNKQEDKAYSQLYRYFNVVKKFVIANGGSRQDAQDIFQDALIIFTNKVQSHSFQQTGQVTSYLYGICRLLWKEQGRRMQRSVQLKQDFSVFTEIGDSEVDTEQEQKAKSAEQALSVLGEKCLQLLKLFYYENKSMADIAAHMGFGSEKLAKNQKFKCLEKARSKYKTLLTA